MIEIFVVGKVERNLIKCTFFLCIVQCGRLCHWGRRKEFLTHNKSSVFHFRKNSSIPILNFILVSETIRLYTQK